MIDDLSLQRALADARVYSGNIDGQVGAITIKAMIKLLDIRLAPATPKRWAAARVRIGAEQVILQDLGLYPEGSKIDGLVGPNTRDAWERWQNAQRVPWIAPEVAAVLATPSVKHTAWPMQGDVPTFFGATGQNQTLLALPYPMRLAWDKTKSVTRISLHRKFAPCAGRVLARAHEKLGETKIRELGLDLFGGSLNVRRMRGGSAWSMHSWGIAIDFDPERNQLRMDRDVARLGKPDAAPWWQLWEDEGCVSLGRARNYDWMHVQAARL